MNMYVDEGSEVKASPSCPPWQLGYLNTSHACPKNQNYKTKIEIIRV